MESARRDRDGESTRHQGVSAIDMVALQKLCQGRAVSPDCSPGGRRRCQYLGHAG